MANHENKYKYSQPHTNNNYGKIMNMNMPPYSNYPYFYPQQMNINQGYPNNNQFSGPNFQNFQNSMNNPNYPPQQQHYPNGYFQNYNNQNMIPQNNNNYNNYNNNYYNRANPNNQKKYNENNKEKNNPLETKLSLDAKQFIPSYKQNDNLFDLSFDGEKFPKKLNILIKPSPIINISNTYVYLNETVFINGRNSTVKIIPKDTYDNQMSSMNKSDVEKFKLAAILANTTVVNFEEARFDPEEKVIIFDIILNYLGKVYFEVKYEDTIITCDDCNASLEIDEDWEQVININYSESIDMGEFP